MVLLCYWHNDRIVAKSVINLEHHMNKKIGVAGVVVAIAAGLVYASPYWTVHQMRQAIIEKNAAKFSEHVDFPVLRENLKAQFMLNVTEKMDTPEMKDNPFATFGKMMAVGLVNQMVETMVTPNGVMVMLESAKAKPEMASGTSSASEGVSTAGNEKKPVEYTLSYQDWSTVKAHPKTADASEGTFIFKRDGLLSWKLSAIDLQ
jgi:hypothetical protein